MKYTGCILYFLLSLTASAQNLSTQMSLLPAQPKAGQKVQIVYNASRGGLADKLFCYLYQNSNQARVSVLAMERKNNQYITEFTVGSGVKSFLMIMHDSLAVIDNNNGQGYWSPVYENGKPVPDALASVADMYAEWHNASFNIEKKADVALELYRQEFAHNPALKRPHMLFYLFAVQEAGNLPKNQYKRELEGFTLFDDLTETELRFMTKFFGDIKEFSKAKELNQLRHIRYPEDANLLEEGIGQFLREFHIEKSFDKKKEMYEAFCARYGEIKDKEAIRRHVFRKGSLLSKMAIYYIRENQMEEWEAKIAELNLECRRSALHLASCDLNNKDTYLDKAEEFARRACELQVEYLNLSRTEDFRFPPSLTDEQTLFIKRKNASWTFQNYGLVLMKNQKLELATTVLKEAATTYAHGEISEINDAYIDCLIKSDQKELAQIEAARLVKSQKATPYIDAFLKQFQKMDSLYKSVDLNDTQNRVPVSLINEPLNFFDFVDADNKHITKEMLAGKIVVVDCWANWCGTCILGFGGMYTLTKKYENNDGVLFLFLNTSEFGGNVVGKSQELMKNRNYRFNLIFDHENLASDKLGVNGLPTKFVIDRNGNIRYKQVGEIQGNIEKLDTVIQQLMN